MGSSEISEMTDASLVVAIARGRREALAEAYRRHGGGVFGLAHRLLGDESAKQIAQEVFLRLWRDPARFDASRGRLRFCLLAETHGQSVAMLRSETARRRCAEVDVRTAADIVDDVERQMQTLAVGVQMRDALARLPEAERRAVALAHLAGNTYREIAFLLEESEGTVNAAIRAGLRRLHLPMTEAGLVGT